jgi:hypothetical protein
MPPSPLPNPTPTLPTRATATSPRPTARPEAVQRPTLLLALSPPSTLPPLVCSPHVSPLHPPHPSTVSASLPLARPRPSAPAHSSGPTLGAAARPRLPHPAREESLNPLDRVSSFTTSPPRPTSRTLKRGPLQPLPSLPPAPNTSPLRPRLRPTPNNNHSQLPRRSQSRLSGQKRRSQRPERRRRMGRLSSIRKRKWSAERTKHLRRPLGRRKLGAVVEITSRSQTSRT